MPPNTPSISGPQQGNTGEEQEYTISAVDPDNDNIYFYIEWGDGFVDEWIGTFASGEEVTVRHTWDELGIYTIRVKAKDIYDAETDWETLDIEMPINNVFNIYQLFLRFLEQHPHMFPILRYLLGLSIIQQYNYSLF